MRCRECEALLWGYVDRELPGAQRQAVAAHLAGCPRCTRAHERLRAFPLQPGQLPAVAPPPDFTARLMQRIAVLPTPGEILAQRERLRAEVGAPFRLFLAFSAAAAALFLGIISTATFALLGGEIGGEVASPPEAANALGAWFTVETHLLFSWPVLTALVGMQLVLALLWFRVALPLARQSDGYETRGSRDAGWRGRR